ncbi:aldo/keto reductase [Telmatocola sphagniphila]|uniref:Aldo/keto reductase n=1 Tax=Telmatocola sphagniphila TaxID=1123043 RepID=A0A8E6BA32_9BACT|nr:aldo/keto reductase [Telmatocola sphagniphila]QVL34157.1 aldo/keto reductase [Telmatocola sphagniphila]
MIETIYKPGTLPHRILGKTGVSVSLICLGGWHIGSLESLEAIRLMHRAIDEGIDFFDNAWDYHMGGSETVMGDALAMDGKRQKVFLMTKNCARDAVGTRQHLEDSLRRLKTDCIDLWQFHECNYDNDAEWLLERGALAEAIKAKKEGKVRFIGFTGHKSPDIHRSVLDIYPDWDCTQFPINVCDHFYRSFEKKFLPVLRERNIGAIGMKSLGGGAGVRGAEFTFNKICDPREARRYALSQDIHSLVVGVDSEKILEQDLAIARDFKPMTEAEMNTLRQQVKAIAGDGRHELFKSTTLHDGPYHREQHGLEKLVATLS